jgi:hypothetical protein
LDRWLTWLLNIPHHHPFGFASVLLGCFVPGVAAYWYRAKRDGEIRMKFGWFRRGENPAVFEWTMAIFFAVIVGLFVLWLLLALKATFG